MKFALLCIFIIAALPLNDYVDAPAYSLSEVLSMAAKLSSECRQVVGEECGWGGKTVPLYEDATPVYAAEYLGKRKWSVVKICPVNPEYNGSWYFQEYTGVFEERSGTKPVSDNPL